MGSLDQPQPAQDGRPQPTGPQSAAPGRKRGQSLVELALVLPLMLLIMLGTIDVGRMFFGYIRVTNAVREGAGYGAHVPDDTAGIKQRITTHATDIASSQVTVTSGPAPTILTCSDIPAIDKTKKAIATITVTATWTFQPIYGGFFETYWPGSGLSTISLTTHSTMKVL